MNEPHMTNREQFYLERIAKVIREADEWVTTTELRDATGLSVATVNKYLLALRLFNRIETVHSVGSRWVGER